MAAKKKKRASRKSSEPKSMEELLEAYGGKPKGLSVGQKVRGRVVEITSKKVILDIGAKSEGVVAEKAFDEAKTFIKDLKVGDEVEVQVLITETPDGFAILSLRKAAYETAWKKLEKAKKEEKPIGVLGKIVNPSGVVVEVMGLSGFIPSSQLGKEVFKNPSDLIGKNFKAIIIDLNRTTNKIVLSEKAVSEAEEIKLIKDALEKMKEGEVYEGVVTTVSDFGCFVEIRENKVAVEGLVHISELSWEKVDKTSDVVSEGDRIKVKVIGKKGGKLSLSMKQAQEDPWDEAEKKYKKDAKVKAKVVRTSDFGVFARLEPGIEGLIHLTKIPPGKRFEKGQEVNVYVEEVDAKSRKVSLGLVLTTKPVGYK
ncbi:MAG: S1 RNA-binding domain-containing protein [Microgenomates group bacterium]